MALKEIQGASPLGVALQLSDAVLEPIDRAFGLGSGPLKSVRI